MGEAMSIRVMTAVFDHSESRLADRLVLLVIADKSDDDGTGCFRGKESIAHLARVSRTTVTEAIARLVAMGELERVSRPGTSNEYRVVLPGIGGRIPADLPGQELADTRPPVRPTPGHPSGRDTSTETPTETSAFSEGEWKPSETDLEAGARTLQQLRARHGFVKRNESEVA